MVSADTVSPPMPPARASSMAMVVGESRATSRASTWSVIGRLRWNLVNLGRHRFLAARTDASAAQKLSRPPLRPTSWDTVEGARSRRRAMSVKDSAASSPTRISSRSCALSTAPAMLGPPTVRRSGLPGHNDRSFATTVGIRPEFPAITHVALTVTSLERSVPWYKALFGSDPILDEDTGPFQRVAWLTGGTLVGLTQFPDLSSTEPFNERRPGLDHLAFGCASRDELRAWEIHLDELGIPNGGIVDAPRYSALSFRDPDNIALEFFAPRG